MSEENKTQVVDITTLAGKFSNRRELQDYAEKLFLALREAVSKIQTLEEKNKHLQELLSKTVPVINDPVKFNVPDEQAIAEIQIGRLKEIAMARALTLDETKQYDLLTKNLYLAKGKPTSVIKAKSRKLDDMEEAELVKLAVSEDDK